MCTTDVCVFSIANCLMHGQLQINLSAGCSVLFETVYSAATMMPNIQLMLHDYSDNSS